jgi:crotonobetainyl-CoA:carnitine CoA-transferase CaiB-like acyl-CoA transferase
MDDSAARHNTQQSRFKMENGRSSLEPYRVLDLTDEKGYLCGQILSGLGADVIKIEPPGGDSGRRVGPFFRDETDPEKSLSWFAFNVHKRSLTLNIEAEEGKDILRRLVRTADFIIESFDPGYLDRLGLGYLTLKDINNGIIMTSITPFGQTGPKKDHKGADIVCWAASGYMWLSGDTDRAPLRTTLPQAYVHAGAEAAMGSMVAFWHRQLSGEGQHVDVSIQESVPWMCLSAQASWDLNRTLLKREGQFRVFGPYRMRQVFECKDGYVVYMLIGGQVGSRGQRNLVQWMEREGMADDFVKSIDWDSFDASTYDDVIARKLEPIFEKFFLTKTKAELYQAAQKMYFLLAPLNNVSDLLHSEHLKARNFWIEINHPELGAVLTYPGAPFKSSELSWRIYQRPPLIGEYNREILENELGLTRREVLSLKENGVI